MSEIIKKAREEAEKSKRSAKLQALPGINISFTSTGLEAVSHRIDPILIANTNATIKLGAFINVQDQFLVKKDRKLSQIFRSKQLRGGLFEKGMYSDLVGEGWDNPQELRKEYQPTEDQERLIDGVIMVTSSLKSDMDAKVSEVKQHFLAEEGAPLNPDTYVISKDPSIELTLVRDGKVRPGLNKGKEQ